MNDYIEKKEKYFKDVAIDDLREAVSRFEEMVAEGHDAEVILDIFSAVVRNSYKSLGTIAKKTEPWRVSEIAGV